MRFDYLSANQMLLLLFWCITAAHKELHFIGANERCTKNGIKVDVRCTITMYGVGKQITHRDSAMNGNN